MSAPSILALIPARGGSKGIPGKNVHLVAGKPLVAHSIEQARQASAVDRVVVSTDDQVIAGVASEYGAEVVHRPVDISGDEASSESALVHALDHLEQEEGYVPDLVLFLQATSPLRQPEDIARAIETLHREGADSLFSACPVHGFVWRLNAQGLSSVSYDFERRQRRQDLGEDLLENGSIYLFKPWVLRRHGNRLGGRIAVHRMDPLDSFQIDEPEDLPRMEQLFQLRRAVKS
ncbi:MAG: acylneuraminate cytidylyltransferase family protein [Deltaproteobacteria bacterium]|nr:acylneuraminate cytidylyltransferase family protein [Deltaproteobacteria bacterium]